MLLYDGFSLKLAEFSHDKAQMIHIPCIFHTCSLQTRDGCTSDTLLSGADHMIDSPSHLYLLIKIHGEFYNNQVFRHFDINVRIRSES